MRNGMTPRKFLQLVVSSKKSFPFHPQDLEGRLAYLASKACLAFLDALGSLGECFSFVFVFVGGGAVASQTSTNGRPRNCTFVHAHSYAMSSLS